MWLYCERACYSWLIHTLCLHLLLVLTLWLIHILTVFFLSAAFKKEYQKLGGSFVALASSFEFDVRPGIFLNRFFKNGLNWQQALSSRWSIKLGFGFRFCFSVGFNQHVLLWNSCKWLTELTELYKKPLWVGSWGVNKTGLVLLGMSNYLCIIAATLMEHSYFRDNSLAGQYCSCIEKCKSFQVTCTVVPGIFC